jgi:CheY-like chemotaxis protein
VLIVEDSPTQALQLACILEDAGFDVEIATDAECGFDRLAGGAFDVVLSDLRLPGGSGFDLCRRIKADPGAGTSRSSSAPARPTRSTSCGGSRPGPTAS